MKYDTYKLKCVPNCSKLFRITGASGATGATRAKKALVKKFYVQQQQQQQLKS